mgnify:FL=1
MEVFNPTGASAVTSPFAPRLKTLHQKKIGLLSNEQWQAHRTLALVEKLLSEEFPLTKFESIKAGMTIHHDATIDAIFKQDFDAVIVGNAA